MGDRPATECKTDDVEIEITPEMIEAGCEAISRYFCFELDDPEKVVCAVFSAMWEAARAAPSE